MSPRGRGLLAFSGLLLAWSGAAAAPTPAKVVAVTTEPAQLVLSHAGDHRHLLVSGKLDDGSERDLTRGVQYTSSNPAVAAVSPQGVVSPKGAGQAVVRISGSGLSASVPVTVKATARTPVSFANDVMP